MIKILSAEQTREADQYTIEHEPISSLELMERASAAFTKWFCSKFSVNEKVLIACGTGNNGGDGLAIARLLSGLSYQVFVIVIGEHANGSPDFQENLKRLRDFRIKISFFDETDFNELLKRDCYQVVVDAIFGSGLSRPVEGKYGNLIELLNDYEAAKVSVDIASGLFANSPIVGGEIFMPDHTVSFQVPKLAFFLPENEKYVGDWNTVSIGLDESYLEQVKANYILQEPIDLASTLKERGRFSHKGHFGHVLLIAGSKGKMGAAVLAARACLRSGVGLLTIYSPACGYEILQNSVPEAMVVADDEDDFLKTVPNLNTYDTVAIGPGIGMHQATQTMFEALLEKMKRPMVVDADAINILGERRDLLGKLPEGSILTPHPKEFERISTSVSNSYERIALLRKLVSDHKLNILVKGAYSLLGINGSDEILINNSGNPGMATGGSGDVLTGVVSSLLAQGYEPDIALQLGVYLHGKAGDLGSAQLGEEALIASDIINNLGNSFLLLRNI